MTDANWLDAAAEDAVFDVIGAVLAGCEISLYNVEGHIHATDNICTHGQARLCDGFLDGFEIECPHHQGRFDVRDGSPTCEPAKRALRS
ncbi:MAG: Rieske 2Fe-2S domain-containing protein [Polaromonas sp.]|nr:Rieske 2Fe-2S domain-containing protein [Polaromonas sp.]